jgi:hypothetical protein
VIVGDVADTASRPARDFAWQKDGVRSARTSPSTPLKRRSVAPAALARLGATWPIVDVRSEAPRLHRRC